MSVDADLATLRDWIGDPEDYSDEDRGAAERACDACDGVEAELSRLREQRDATMRSYDSCLRTLKKAVETAEAAEARCARLQQALQEVISDLEAGRPGDALAYVRGFSTNETMGRATRQESVAFSVWKQALAGPDTPDNRQRFEFDTSEIPPDATVTAATLRLTPDTTADSQEFTPSRAPVDPPIILPADSQEDKT
jgi:hypothetical protein